MKQHVPVLVAREDAVEYEHMEVDVQVQTAESLNREHRSAPSIVEPGALRSDTVAREDRLDEHARQRGEHVSIEAASRRSSYGSERTYCLKGTSGRTRSTKNAATFAIRLPQQLGQMLRPWHEKATRRSWPQASHRTLEKPSEKSPQAT
ncbi:MAG: hypothetical protein M3O46_01415 [Myxococcota bacterium]|nr:hypothetical protein [Myxococcota bacterium]